MKGIGMSLLTAYVVITLALFIFGIVLRYKPPRTINSLAGFRTKKSTASQKSWDLAQRLCANSLIFISVISAMCFVIIVVSGIYAELSDDNRALFLLIPAILLILSIPFINNKLPSPNK